MILPESYVSRDLQSAIEALTPEQREIYMDFVEKIHGLKPGEMFELPDAVFFCRADGSLAAILPQTVVESFNKKFPDRKLS